MTERRKIRWLIAHYPLHLFIRTAKKFSQELELLCPGQFTIEIHTIDSYVKKYNELEDMLKSFPNIANLEDKNAVGDKLKNQVTVPGEIKTKWQALFNGLADGKFELSQTQVGIVGHHLHKNFNALDLPFLFTGHDHVTDVLDGEIGDELCKELSEKTKIRGLGFTYSGGYRVIGSVNGITNLTELMETKLMTHTTPSTILFRKLGADPIVNGRAEVADLGDISKDGAIETTYLRYTGKHVLKTDHSIFMTTILTGNGFWDTLTPEQQEAFKIAAKRVATTERSWSIEDADKYEKEAEANGVTIVEISDEDKAMLREAAARARMPAVLEAIDIDLDLVNRIIEKGVKK